MKERWLPVVGWEGLYEVSDLGRVRSVDRIVEMRHWRGGTLKRLHQGRILRARRVSVALDFPAGYLAFSPSVEGVHHPNVMVHTAVLEAFKGPRPLGAEGRHLNGKPHDNRMDNLAWGTAQENAADKERHGKVYRGDASPSTKLTSARLAQARAAVQHIPLWKVARSFGVSPKTLSKRLVASGCSVGSGRKVYA